MTDRFRPTYLDRHPGQMETHWEQRSLSQHSLITSRKLNLGDRECVAKMERSVHVRVWKRSKPFRLLLVELFKRLVGR